MKQLAKRILSFVLVLCLAVIGVVTTPILSAKAEGAWTLVTNVSDLAVGDKVIIAAKDYNYAMSTTQNKNNRGQAEITKSSDTATWTTAVQELTLKAGTTAGTFAFYTGSGYLYAASSSSNYLRTETSLSANSSWNISITSAGVATIKATGSNTRNWLRYNATNTNPGPIFACYSSGQQDICLYKYVEATGGEEIPEEPTPTITIGGDINYTQVGGTITLTATPENVTGTIVWTSSDNNVATVDADGKVTALDMGKTTITAAIGEVTATKEIIVYPVANSVLTIAQALQVCELTGNANAPYQYSVTGTIKTIDEAYSTQYYNITVTITDGTNNIKVFRLKGEGCENLQVGDVIAVTGTLINYQGNTPEFNSGCTFVLVETDAELKAVKEALNAVEAQMQLAYTYDVVGEQKVEVEVPVEVEDTLDKAFTGNPSSYTDWSNKGNSSSAVYAGQSSGNYESIQLRSDNNNSGIVTTTSGGKAIKITVVWNDKTSSGRTLEIYGKNTAYDSAADLYGDAKGELLGTIVYGTSTELTINGNYAYIGLRSADKAMYLSSVVITWENKMTTGETETVEALGNSNFFLKCGIKASVADIENITSYGIKVTAGDKTAYYTSEANSWTVDEENEVIYVVIELGDIINDLGKLGTEFTVTAYVEYDGEKIESTQSATYSVATMVAEYNSEGYDVEHLYNYLDKKGLI